MSAKILIVDDEPNILLSLEYLFKKAKYQVYIARDGSEALELIGAHAPEVILLDIMMPEVDGYAVCRHVKGSEALNHIKVIFMSAKTKEADIEAGYAAGADLYFTKPFSNKKLMAAVKELLAGNEA